MTSSANPEESILVEKGVAPILWAAYLHEQSGCLATKKNLVHAAKHIMEAEEDVPEAVVVESHLLIERMEYENQTTFATILKAFPHDSPKELSSLGIQIGLAAARVRNEDCVGGFAVPEVDVAEAFSNELPDPFMDLFSAERHESPGMSR